MANVAYILLNRYTGEVTVITKTDVTNFIAFIGFLILGAICIVATMIFSALFFTVGGRSYVAFIVFFQVIQFLCFLNAYRLYGK